MSTIRLVSRSDPIPVPANPLHNGTTSVNGVVFVPGTSSVLFVGTTATNYVGYGTPEEYGGTMFMTVVGRISNAVAIRN